MKLCLMEKPHQKNYPSLQLPPRLFYILTVFLVLRSCNYRNHFMSASLFLLVDDSCVNQASNKAINLGNLFSLSSSELGQSFSFITESLRCYCLFMLDMPLSFLMHAQFEILMHNSWFGRVWCNSELRIYVNSNEVIILFRSICFLDRHTWWFEMINLIIEK